MKVYIAGKITGDTNYKAKFCEYEDKLMKVGIIALNPARLPEGMKAEDYMRICFSMIDSADEVHFLTDFGQSEGTLLELHYCQYTGKRVHYVGGYPCKVVQGAMGAE